MAGSYQDVSAVVLLSTINACYKFTDHVGLMFGIVYFDASIEIDDDIDKTDITYGYDGDYIDMHFMF